MLHPLSRRTRTCSTEILVPLLVGFPVSTSGSLVMWSRQFIVKVSSYARTNARTSRRLAGTSGGTLSRFGGTTLVHAVKPVRSGI